MISHGNVRFFNCGVYVFHSVWRGGAKIDKNAKRAILQFMKKISQVHIYKGDRYFIADCIDLPVVTQGKTLDELVENLKEAIAL